MNVKKKLLSASAPKALTTAGMVEYYLQHNQAMPPINHIYLRTEAKPATASVEPQHGRGNAANDTKA